MTSKLKFKTWREDVKRVNCSSGDPVRITYSGKYDDDGCLVVEEVGKENIYELIQSYAESVDINNILMRFQQGDTTALEKAQGFYADATAVPKNMADLLNKLNRAEAGFEKLPADFKEKYGNDFARFICSFDPSDFEEVLDNPQSVEKTVETSNDTTAKDGD